MKKKYIHAASIVILFWMTVWPTLAKDIQNLSDIKRLTYSGSNLVQSPCLSDDGQWMLYVTETRDGEKTMKAVRVMNIETGEERELFRDGQRKGLKPYDKISLLVGSKPPLLSGNGHVAVFSLSLDKPVSILDHYLAVVNTDGTNFWLTPFPINALKEKDFTSFDFSSRNWERVSNYVVSRDGNRIACVCKGHLGPRRYGNPSGLIFLDTKEKKQRTILAPDFNGNNWNWPSFPRRPLTGGGWALCISGNGQRIVFGAQSSSDIIDYNLYVSNWNGTEIKRITDFHDRWFSLADISHEGDKIVFYYNGKKKQGIGTYSINIDGTGLKYLESRSAPRIDFFDMSGNGRYILYKHIYKGMILDLHTSEENVAFDEHTSGYVKGIIPMDFPCLPAFWGSRIMSFNGDKILLVGPPQGKKTPEIYILNIKMK